ncbi:MAG TPA: cupin domain-containing protein [Caulobacteraceae bacterium]
MADGRPYSVKAVTVLARGQDVLVREFVFAPGEATPWHRHGAVSDLCYVVTGQIALETRSPTLATALGPGERAETAAGRVHRLINLGDEDCRLILIQAGGTYDFKIEP